MDQLEFYMDPATPEDARGFSGHLAVVAFERKQRFAAGKDSNPLRRVSFTAFDYQCVCVTYCWLFMIWITSYWPVKTSTQPHG